MRRKWNALSMEQQQKQQRSYFFFQIFYEVKAVIDKCESMEVWDVISSSPGGSKHKIPVASYSLVRGVMARFESGNQKGRSQRGKKAQIVRELFVLASIYTDSSFAIEWSRSRRLLCKLESWLKISTLKYWMINQGSWWKLKSKTERLQQQ